MSRGVEAFRAQARAAGEQRLSGFANILLMKSGDSVMGRFRGLFAEPAVKLTEEDIRGLTPDWLAYWAAVLGIAQQKSMDEWVRAILLRYKQVEPFIYDQHYIHGAKGREAYHTCAQRWSPSAPCPICYAKDSGDSRVSLRTQYVVSFHPHRWYHKLEGKPGMKATYADCLSAQGEACRYCDGGHQVQQEKCRYLSLAEMHMAGLVACSERVSQRCGVCGIGKVQTTGYVCPHLDCGEPLSNYRPLPPAQQPEVYSPVVTCPACQRRIQPQETLRCNKGCDDARRCQMHEVDVLVQRMGERKTTTYSFTEQWPAEPLSEDLLASNLPSYEFAMKPKDSASLCRAVGLVSDPFTGGAVGGEPTPMQAQASPYDEDPDAAVDPQPGSDQDINW